MLETEMCMYRICLNRHRTTFGGHPQIDAAPDQEQSKIVTDHYTTV